MPPIPGLAEVPFLTNETLFANDVLPAHLVIIGGGPIGGGGSDDSPITSVSPCTKYEAGTKEIFSLPLR